MQIVRITLSAEEVLKQKEPEFQLKLTKKLINAGFDLRDTIIRQDRSDIDGADFIQLKYGFIDKVMSLAQFFIERNVESIINKFKKNGVEKKEEDRENN